MKIDLNDININRYLNNQLKGNDLTAFEALLQKDKALQEKVNFHKEVDVVLKEKMAPVKTFEKEEAELKPLLKSLGAEFFLNEAQTSEQTAKAANEPKAEAKPGIVKRLYPLVGLAAAAALLLFLFFPKQNNKLFTQFFELPSIETTLSPPTDFSTFDEAKAAYKAENYKQAIILFEQSLEENADNPKAMLYKGGAELELNKISDATTTFQQLANQHPKYADVAHWYLALAHLKKGDKESTRNTLKLITKKDKTYYDKAQQLLKALN